MNHAHDLLDDAQEYLVTNKRAGAVQALIDATRMQERRLDDLEARMKQVESLKLGAMLSRPVHDGH